MKQPIERLYYRWKLYDADGKLIKHSGLRKARSFLKNYVEFQYIHANQTARTLTSMTGSNVLCARAGSTNHRLALFNFTGGTAQGITIGVLVGSGVTAVDIEDKDLATRIADGSGSGQLVYSSSVVSPAQDVDGGDSVRVIVHRMFHNRSGGVVTVNEVGLACPWRDNFATPGLHPFLVVRDILNQSVAVPDGATLSVDYTLKITL